MKLDLYKLGIFKKVILLLFLLNVYSLGYGQQGVQFSQYVFNGLIVNPAYAGYKETLNAHFIYRNQWTGLNGAPSTSTFTLDGVSKNLKHGTGVQVVVDKLGAQSNLQADFSYAFRIPMGDLARLSFGLAAGISQFKLDGSKLTTFDPSEDLSSQTKSLLSPDLRFGIFYASNQYFFGFSATDLFSSQLIKSTSFYVIQPSKHYYLTFGGLYNVSDNISVKPSFLLKEDFKAPLNVDFNLFLLFNEKLWVGGSYRTGFNVFELKSTIAKNLSSTDAVSVMADYFINPTLRVGYAFDYSLTSIKTIAGGSHELSVALQLDNWFHHRLQNPRLF